VWKNNLKYTLNLHLTLRDARLIMCLHYSNDKLAVSGALSGILTGKLLGKLSCGGLRR